MAAYTTLDQVEAARRKRQTVFEKARAMRESGQISAAEFQMLESKYLQKMKALDAAEQEIRARMEPPVTPVPVVAEAADPDEQELLGMARDILGQPPPPESSAGGDPAPSPESPLAALQAYGEVAEPLEDPTPTSAELASMATPAPGEPPDLGKPASGEALDAPAVVARLAAGSLPVGDLEGQDLARLGAEEPDLERVRPAPPVLDAGGAVDVVSAGAAPPPPPPAGGAGADLDDPDDGDPFGGEGPPQGLDEMSELSRDLGSGALGGHDDFFAGRGQGDGDLMSLVRPVGLATSSDDVEGYRIQAQTERSAREQAEKEARTRSQEAKDMHEAFRRTVEQKDLMGQRIERLTRMQRDLLGKLQLSVGVGLAMVLLVLLYGSWSQGAVEKRLTDMQGRLKAAEGERGAARAEAQTAAGEVDDLRGRLDARTARVDELEQELRRRQQALDGLRSELEERRAQEPLPGEGAAPEPLDRRHLFLLGMARLDDLEPARRAFVERVASRGLDWAPALDRQLRDRPVEEANWLEKLVNAIMDGSFGAALQAGERAADESELDADRIAALIGRVHLAYGSPAPAIRRLEAVAWTDPAFLPARLDLAEAYVKRKQRGEARALLEELMRRDDLETTAWIRVGTIAERAFASDLARRAYQRAHELAPKDPVALAALSGMAIEKADFAAARDLLVQAAEANPDNLEIHFNLALAYLGLGDRRGAEARIEHLRRRRWRETDLEDLESRLADLPPAPEEPAPVGAPDEEDFEPFDLPDGG